MSTINWLGESATVTSGDSEIEAGLEARSTHVHRIVSANGVEAIYRHNVPATNQTVQLLQKLEEEFRDNKKELAKIRSIVVLDDQHILIAGFRHKLGVAIATADNASWVFDNGWYTLFTHEAAMKFAKSQTEHIAYKRRELALLMGAIPGGRNETARELLRIPLAGYRLPNGITLPVGDSVDLWSSTVSGARGGYCHLWQGYLSPTFGSFEVNYAFSLILRQK